MNESERRTLEEQNFPSEGMNTEQRNTYLNIIKHCKDICDSKFLVNDSSKCEIIEMRLKKDGMQIKINGILNIGSEENRCIDGYIFLYQNRTLVDTHITRLLSDGQILEYTVLDEFKIINGKLIRNSFYNDDMKTIASEIEDVSMKGMIK